MRKADLITIISEKTGIPKVDVLVTIETLFKEVKDSLINNENIYIRGFGSFVTKKRAAKLGRNIKRNTAVLIPEHHIPAFKPAKEFVSEVKSNASWTNFAGKRSLSEKTAVGIDWRCICAMYLTLFLR